MESPEIVKPRAGKKTSCPIRPFIAFANIENPNDALFVIDIVKDTVVSDFEAVLSGVLINDKRGFDLGFSGRARVIGQAFDALHDFILNLGRNNFQSLMKLFLNGFRGEANAVFQGLDPSPPEDGFVLRRRQRSGSNSRNNLNFLSSAFI